MAKQIIDSERPDIKPTVYAYTLPKIHPGYIKIGYTGHDVKNVLMINFIRPV